MQLDRLRVVVHAPAGVLAPERLQRLLAREAESFADALVRHFAFEEAGGLANAVAAPNASQHRRIAALAEQHRALASHAAELARRAAEFDAASIVATVEALARELEAHERDEAQLIQGALGDQPSEAD